jgi:micrococcal nuclease
VPSNECISAGNIKTLPVLPEGTVVFSGKPPQSNAGSSMISRRAASLLIPFIVAFCLCAGCSTDTGSPSDTGIFPGQSASITTGTAGAATSGAQATVTATIDGDTVRISFSDGRTETLRILGIDTPEVTPEGNDPRKFEGVTDLSYLSLWGEEAASYTHAQLDGEKVTITYDRDAGTRDSYGRLLAMITRADGTDYGEELLRQGLARVYTPETFARKDRYLAVQEEARDARLGVWSGQEPASRDAGQVAIASVHYNAAGDDSENLNDEYFTIRNGGTTTADLTSWQVRDSDGFVYTFPSVTLSSRESLKVHTGSGMPSSVDLFMGSPDPVLNNDGDTITLTDREGKEVSSFSWG